MEYLDQWDYQKLEMETQNEMFMKMQAMCFRKCVKKTKDSDFPIGEMSCSDRCVSKFFETHKILMAQFEVFKKQKEQEQMILAQQAQQQQAAFGGVRR